LGIIKNQEVCMGTEGRRKFDKEFKVETVRLIVEGGRKLSEVARNFDIHENVLRKWKQQYQYDRFGAFPGKGNLKPDEGEYRKLLKENADLKEERDILKNCPKGIHLSL
jgi:transposase